MERVRRWWNERNDSNVDVNMSTYLPSTKPSTSALLITQLRLASNLAVFPALSRTVTPLSCSLG